MKITFTHEARLERSVDAWLGGVDGLMKLGCMVSGIYGGRQMGAIYDLSYWDYSLR